MKIKISFLLILYSLIINGQETAVFEKLHSTEIDNSIYLLFDGKTFSYSKEWLETDKSFITIKKDEIKQFQVSNDDNNNFKMYLAFYNPLQVKIENSESEEDDSNYTSISTFLENIPVDLPFSSDMSSGDAAKTFATSKINNYSSLKGVNKTTVDENLKAVNQIIKTLPKNSMLLYDWVKLFNEHIAIDKIARDNIYTQAFKTKTDVIDGVTAIEHFLFKPIEIAIDRNNRPKKTVNEWITYAHDTLYNADQNLESFSAKLTASKQISDALIKKRETASKNLEALKNMFSKDLVTIESLLDLNSTTKKEFRNLSMSKVVFIEAMVSDRMELLNRNLSVLLKLNKRLTNFTDAFRGIANPVGYKLIEDDKFPWSYEKTKVYDIKSTKLLQNGDADKDGVYAIKVKVFKSQGRLAVFPSLGLFYTPFEYKNYGISEGVVAETQGDAVYFRPAAYLNFLLRPKKGDILYPMLQIGVTQGIKTPLFPVGIGFSIRDRFSITIGPLLAFQNELDKLTIGATADDAILKDDINTRVRVSWYLSLNYKLGK
ncbi:hypothetical protein A9Q86_04255 [Flavobacteriales bacterium 33_180_T64]|nr:hypothetical protein A9Q86_04255 [Flavobacteriales bacterium 33_180_T64]